MDIDNLKKLAYKLMADRKAHLEREKGFIYYHGERVSNISLKLRKIILPEDDSHDDIITAACLFHDIAKGIEPHGHYGAVLVRDVLKGYCTDDEIQEIAEIIRCHQLRDKSKAYSDYIKIVQDADILDHFGTIEIWMNFQYYAHKDEPMHNSIEFYKNEFNKHAKNCRELLNYDISQKIFDDKINFVYSFVQRFEVEVRGDWCEMKEGL